MVSWLVAGLPWHYDRKYGHRSVISQLHMCPWREGVCKEGMRGGKREREGKGSVEGRRKGGRGGKENTTLPHLQEKPADVLYKQCDSLAP